MLSNLYLWSCINPLLSFLISTWFVLIASASLLLSAIWVFSLLSVLLKVCQSWRSYFKSNKSWFHFLYFHSHGFLFFFFFSFFLLVLGLFCSIILDSWGASLGYWSDLRSTLTFSPKVCIQYYKSSINTDMLYFHIHSVLCVFKNFPWGFHSDTWIPYMCIV